MLDTNQIDSKFNSIDIKMKGLSILIEKLNSELSNKLNINDLNRNVNELRSLITDNSTLIRSLEEKLSKVILPEETRYYLNEGEVASFQSNFNALKAMMNKLDQLFKNIVSYQSNISS